MKLPAGVHRAHLDLPGQRLALLQAGAAGPLVLLVPGYTGSKEDFRFLLAPLAAAGYRAVALDQPGQFESPGPDEPGAYTVAALAGHVLAAVRGLGAPAHLVGHSFGGLVARAAVIAEPASFSSLSLIGSGPAALVGPRTQALALLQPLLLERGLAAVADAVEAGEVAAGGRQPPALREFLRERFLRSSPGGLLGMAEALTGEPDRVGELARTGVPVLVLHGVNDDAWPPSLQAEMAQRLGARHVVVPRAAHSPAVENRAATVAALREFLASTCPPGADR